MPTPDDAEDDARGRGGFDRDDETDPGGRRARPAELDPDPGLAGRRPPWTNMALAEEDGTAAPRGAAVSSSAGRCRRSAASAGGASPTTVPSSRAPSTGAPSKSLPASSPTCCRGLLQCSSRCDRSRTCWSAAGSRSVRNPPCAASGSVGSSHQCEPSPNCDVRPCATAAGCSGGTTMVHECPAWLWTTWKASATSA